MDARFIHLVTASTLTALVGLYPYLVRRNEITKLFAKSHVLLGLWCMDEIVAFLPGSHHLHLIIYRLSYTFGIFMEWYWYQFLMAIARRPLSDFPKTLIVFRW